MRQLYRVQLDLPTPPHSTHLTSRSVAWSSSGLVAISVGTIASSEFQDCFEREAIAVFHFSHPQAFVLLETPHLQSIAYLQWINVTLVSGDLGGTVCIWRMKDQCINAWECVFTYTTEDEGELLTLSWMPPSSEQFQWPPRNDATTLEKKFMSSSSPPTAEWNSSGNHFVGVFSQGQVVLWTSSSGIASRSWGVHSCALKNDFQSFVFENACIGLKNDGHFLVAASCLANPQTIFVFDVAYDFDNARLSSSLTSSVSLPLDILGATVRMDHLQFDGQDSLLCLLSERSPSGAVTGRLQRCQYLSTQAERLHSVFESMSVSEELPPMLNQMSSQQESTAMDGVQLTNPAQPSSASTVSSQDVNQVKVEPAQVMQWKSVASTEIPYNGPPTRNVFVGMELGTVRGHVTVARSDGSVLTYTRQTLEVVSEFSEQGAAASSASSSLPSLSTLLSLSTPVVKQESVMSPQDTSSPTNNPQPLAVKEEPMLDADGAEPSSSPVVNGSHQNQGRKRTRDGFDTPKHHLFPSSMTSSPSLSSSPNPLVAFCLSPFDALAISVFANGTVSVLDSENFLSVAKSKDECRRDVADVLELSMLRRGDCSDIFAHLESYRDAGFKDFMVAVSGLLSEDWTKFTERQSYRYRAFHRQGLESLRSELYRSAGLETDFLDCQAILFLHFFVDVFHSVVDSVCVLPDINDVSKLADVETLLRESQIYDAAHAHESLSDMLPLTDWVLEFCDIFTKFIYASFKENKSGPLGVSLLFNVDFLKLLREAVIYSILVRELPASQNPTASNRPGSNLIWEATRSVFSSAESKALCQLVLQLCVKVFVALQNKTVGVATAALEALESHNGQLSNVKPSDGAVKLFCLDLFAWDKPRCRGVGEEPADHSMQTDINALHYALFVPKIPIRTYTHTHHPSSGSETEHMKIDSAAVSNGSMPADGDPTAQPSMPLAAPVAAPGICGTRLSSGYDVVTQQRFAASALLSRQHRQCARCGRVTLVSAQSASGSPLRPDVAAGARSRKWAAQWHNVCPICGGLWLLV